MERDETEYDDDAQQFLRQVGRRLAAARQAAGYSLQQVADHLGNKSRAMVGHWETGKNPIDLAKLRRLARHYGTTVVALVADDLETDDVVALVRRGLERRATEPAATTSQLLRTAPTVEPDKAFRPAPLPSPATPSPAPPSRAAHNVAAPKAGAKKARR
jgi:transcriptional regulator with XRE-family HTH domain